MQKTAYEIGISDWSSDVCSSDLTGLQVVVVVVRDLERPEAQPLQRRGGGEDVTTGKGNVLDARPEAFGDEMACESLAVHCPVQREPAAAVIALDDLATHQTSGVQQRHHGPFCGSETRR